MRSVSSLNSSPAEASPAPVRPRWPGDGIHGLSAARIMQTNILIHPVRTFYTRDPCRDSPGEFSMRSLTYVLTYLLTRLLSALVGHRQLRKNTRRRQRFFFLNSLINIMYLRTHIHTSECVFIAIVAFV